MDFNQKLKQYKKFVIMAGLAIGALTIVDLLPTRIDFLGEYTVYLYLGIIVLAGYSYWQFHWNTQSPSIGAGFERTVPARNLSSPAYLREIERQRGKYEQKRSTHPETAGEHHSQPQPGNEIYKRFNKEGG